MQTVWLGGKGTFPVDCEEELTDEGESSVQPIVQCGKQTRWLPNVSLLCYHLHSPEQTQASLAKEAGGGKTVGLMPTWVPAGRILHMLLSAQWHSGLPFTFLITLKFSHMVLLPIWTRAQWQLVLETYCAPRALKFRPHCVPSQ